MELNKKQYGLLTISLRNENFDENKVNELKEFEIDINDFKDILKEIDYEVELFLEDKKKLLKMPFLTEEDLIDNSVVSLAHEVIRLENELQSYNELRKKYEDFKARLKVAMQENNVDHWETPGGTKITLVADGQDKIVKKFNEKKFKEENELLYNKYLEDKEQKGKAGYVLITLKKEN